MRSKPHQFESLIIRLPVDQDKVGFDVTVTKSGPVAAQRMIGTGLSGVPDQ
jgi:hypothetical protein